ncbi:MCE family protein [Spongiactinospora sp. TRM90649]|uniref:MCE family protein n=1 Tax=Spongiactinospora sp. TRM90649 TaxID=3031114 RepID=UPI0023F95525|nr:MCE family protein [Spongiactinospora sp. TRM90649]MDF5755904.1 MCE family protein [Spongiactinospora sp. TRM90649]
MTGREERRRPRRVPRRAWAVPIVLAALTSAVAVALLVRETFVPRGVLVTAAFPRAGQGLDTSSPVKIRGVTVGRVGSIALGGDGRAVIGMRLAPGVRVPRTASAAVEPASVFGPKYIALTPGPGERGGPYLASGERIARTLGPRDLSETLADAYRVLGAADPREVSVIVHTLGRGLDGRGAELGAIIDDTSALVRVAHRRRAEARRFLADAAALAGTLSDKGDEVVGIAADTGAVLPGLVARADGVRSILASWESTARLAAHGLRARRADLKAAVSSGERAVALVRSLLGVAGDGVRTTNRIIPVIGDLTTGDGPDGADQLKIAWILDTDLCATFLGLCAGPSRAAR